MSDIILRNIIQGNALFPAIGPIEMMQGGDGTISDTFEQPIGMPDEEWQELQVLLYTKIWIMAERFVAPEIELLRTVHGKEFCLDWKKNVDGKGTARWIISTRPISTSTDTKKKGRTA